MENNNNNYPNNSPAHFGAIADRAEAFQRVRDVHQREVTEDYVELIDDLKTEKGEARSVDLAHCLGVSQATVNKTLSRLQRDGYIISEPYRAIFLTESGKKLAQWSKKRHQIVLDFLIHIGVSPETARSDAEGLEHHVSDETLSVFQRSLAEQSQPDS